LQRLSSELYSGKPHAKEDPVPSNQVKEAENEVEKEEKMTEQIPKESRQSYSDLSG